MEFIFFEDTWNEGTEKNIQPRTTSTASKKTHDSKKSQRPDQVYTEDKA